MTDYARELDLRIAGRISTEIARQIDAFCEGHIGHKISILRQTWSVVVMEIRYTVKCETCNVEHECKVTLS